MFAHLPYKTKQFFFVLIKLSIVYGAFYFIYKKLANNNTLDFHVFYNYVSESEIFSFTNILLLIALSVVNWSFEVLKWKNLVSVLTKISFYEALKQTLGSLTASLFTPNRIGEYGAKAMFFNSSLRKRVLLLNLLSNIAQMTTTLIFGCIGFTLFYLQYDVDISLQKIARFLVLVILVSGFIFLSHKYLNIKVKGFSVEKLLTFFKDISKEIHLKNILFSIIRYTVFSFQFFILLRLFGVDVYYYNAMLVITSMYLIASLVPSIFIFDVVVKGSIALFLFGIVGVNDLTILSIITLMWILNFVIPSIIGSIFVMQYDYKKLKSIH